MTMMQSILIHPPLAAVDLVHAAIMLVAVFFGIMKLLFESTKNANKKRPGAPAGAQQPQPKPQAGAPKPVQAAGQQADPLRSQVEEFLRRAGRPPQGGQEQSRPQQQRPASEIELLVDDASQSSDRRSRSESNRPDPLTPGALPIAKPRPAAKSEPKRAAHRSVIPKRRVTLAERAAEREEIRVGNLAEQPAHLGNRIIEEDKQFDEQIKAKFDHALGTLAGSGSSAAVQPSAPVADSPARQIAAMLANPDGVRQAVLLNEILRRPSDRW